MSLILVVDDSEPVRALIAEVLESHGYEVLQAPLVEKAVAILKQRTPDLIVLDLILPDMDGRDFCRILRQKTETRHIPVIMVTATELDKVQGFQAGADDYVMKPIQVGEFLARVQAVLRRVQQPLPETRPSPAAAAASVLPPQTAPAPAPTLAPSLASAATANARAAAVPAAVPSPAPNAGPTWREAALALILSPREAGRWPSYPSSVGGTLGAVLFLLLAGNALAPGMRLSPWSMSSAALLLCGMLCASLTVAGSLLGLKIGWREGARILSLAALPLVLKFLLGLIVAAVTSLSPLLASASPSLVFRSGPGWLSRLDLFELWAAYLLWILLKGKCDEGKAAACAAAVWAAGNVSALAMSLLSAAR